LCSGLRVSLENGTQPPFLLLFSGYAWALLLLFRLTAGV